MLFFCVHMFDYVFGEGWLGMCFFFSLKHPNQKKHRNLMGQKAKCLGENSSSFMA